jgi:hypothetical protein
MRGTKSVVRDALERSRKGEETEDDRRATASDMRCRDRPGLEFCRRRVLWLSSAR